MLALVLAIALQDVDRLIRELGDDDLDVRTRATEALVKAGPAAKPALEKAVTGANAEVRARIAAVLKAIARGERVAELRKHCEVLEGALWIEKPGIAIAGEAGIGTQVVPELFAKREPQLVLAYWEGDFERLSAEPFGAILQERPTGGGGFVSRQVFRRRGPGNEFSTGIDEASWKEAENGTLDEMIRHWPAWEPNAPILALQEGMLVVPSRRDVAARLVDAAASKRTSLRLTALHALRYYTQAESMDAAVAALKHDDAKTRAVALETARILTGCSDEDVAAWWEKNRGDAKKIFERQGTALYRSADRRWWEIPVDWKADDAKARAMQFLNHPDPRAQRDAALVASMVRAGEALPRLRELVSASAPELREQCVRSIVVLDPDGCLPVLQRALEDMSPDVRTTAVILLPASAWKSAAKLLGDADSDVRREAIRKLHQAREAGPLRERLAAEKDDCLHAMLAVALVLLDADRDAAGHLVDTVLAGESGIRRDALYALNRMTDAKTFDRVMTAKWLEMDPNERWGATVEAFQKAAGVEVVVRKETDTLKWLQGSSWGETRLTPAILPRLLQYIEDPTDEPGWSFLIEDGKFVILPLPDAVEHWRKWRAEKK